MTKVYTMDSKYAFIIGGIIVIIGISTYVAIMISSPNISSPPSQSAQDANQIIVVIPQKPSEDIDSLLPTQEELEDALAGITRP